jgi:hypothetical protein
LLLRPFTSAFLFRQAAALFGAFPQIRKLVPEAAAALFRQRL